MNEVIGVFNADDEATALAVVARDQAEWKSATGLPVPEYVLTLATFYGPGAEWEGPC